MAKNHNQNNITSNGMKKLLPYVLTILITLVGLFSPMRVDAQATGSCSITPIVLESACISARGIWTPTPPLYTPRGSCSITPIIEETACRNAGGTWTPLSTPATDEYQFLVPLPCPNNTSNCVFEDGKWVLKSFDSSDTNSLGTYLNIVIKIIIGLAAVLAVVMIVIGGIEYMTSELISGKEVGRERITQAIFGLILALGAYTLLFTINPDLLSTDISINPATITVTLDEANFARTEGAASQVGTRYVSGTANSNVSSFVSRNVGQSLTNISVNTNARTANFCVRTDCVSVPINIGQGGIAEAGQAQAGDNKTPKGTTTISRDVRVGSNGNAVLSRNGYNLGAAFINIGATVNGGDRGIGFHGSYDDTLRATNGCIRMRNADLIALSPYMRPGVQVIIR